MRAMTELERGLPAHLIEGHHRFRATRFAAEHERYRALGEGSQRPATMIVACSDSRAAPETVFDAAPGELFVVRNVAALVPEYAPDAQSHGASAALEYAVLALGVRSIVVMGHGRCGGIAAALEPQEPLSTTDFIGTWVAGVRDLAGTLTVSTDDADARRLALEHASIERSIEHLRTFPWIRSREMTRTLDLHGAWFDIALGELHALGPEGWRNVTAG